MYQQLNELYRAREDEILPRLVRRVKLGSNEQEAIRRVASGLVEAVRGHRSGWIESFLQEYGLSDGEGIALLGLAEAYLRVPDAYTADSLICDKLASGNWRSHLGARSGLFVNSATLAFVVSQSILNAGPNQPIRRLLAKLSTPVIRRTVATSMRLMGGRFVVGQTIQEAMRNAEPEICSFDMLGESARTAKDADRYFSHYRNAIEIAGRSTMGVTLAERHSISVKLSALHPRYEEAHAKRVVGDLTARVIDLARAAAAANIGLTIDAEEADRLLLSLDIISAVAADRMIVGWDGLGMAIQAYQKRASAVIAWADDIGSKTRRRLAVRLVKGAYWDTEVKRGQEQGLSDYPVFTRKCATDVSYLACARQMLDSKRIQPAFATHNAHTIAALLHWIGGRRDVEFQRLHGMGEALHATVKTQTGLNTRLYAPVGGYQDLLAYLVRRLLENGANSSFIHQSSDPTVPIDVLLGDPVDAIEKVAFAMHPAVPLPSNLYGAERRNSEGLDLSNRDTIKATMTSVKDLSVIQKKVGPIIGGVAIGDTTASRDIRSPNDRDRLLGWCVDASIDDVNLAIRRAEAAAPLWSARSIEERAVVLERMANLLEENRPILMALAVQEAGKSIPDAIAEVREAVDFCRYYASQARKQFSPQYLEGPTGERDELVSAGRGVFVCISPWNFPLAIFTGQIAAALVAGNAVIAKPAPQTPLIADLAVQLFHRAGIPGDVLSVLPGGAEIGKALVASPAVSGVAFTGSTAAARRIAYSLLEDERRPLIPLIAETGGINAMIVDSTALPEQVVADVITSAFRSAGQRCSALRLLCLQEEIADRVLEMLKGAMDEIVIGDSASITTDVGPVIDAAAKAAIDAHIAANGSNIIYRRDIGDSAKKGHYISPTIIRLGNVSDLESEIFGPVLHVVTWKANKLKELVGEVNRNGYGLTMGLHSRLSSTVEQVRNSAHVGNLYVNRTMTGAVVGVQPFGGEGLSGTGPKAGGPNYLMRFAVERVVSIDTTAAGGNASLMNLASSAL